MEFAVKRFARNILVLHVVLLLIVLGLVVLASRAIRSGAREQAKRQAESRQRLLATQTARGIEAFYRSILSDMDLLPRQEETQIERDKVGSVLKEMSRDVFLAPLGPQTRPTSRPAGGPGGSGNRPNPPRPQQVARGLLLGQLLGRQLEERVTHLFVVNRPIKATGTLDIHDVAVHPKIGEGPTPEEVADRYRNWIRDVKSQEISKFELFGNRGYNLVALPIGNKGAAVLVAAVPVSTITEQFLALLNSDPGTTVMLVNDSLTIMAASRPPLVGTSAEAQADRDFHASLQALKAGGYKGSQLVEHAFKIGAEDFEPAMLSAEPIDVAGRKWFIVVGSPLEEVDGVVGQVFGRIFIWAVIVVIAISAILLSTSINLIRGRMKLERVRMETLHKEIDRARQIQQAWLPRESPACPTVDVAAVNFPANHISGDFYNWFDLPDGRIAIAIGDVTGHGMSAAFLMATTQLLVRTTMQRISDPAACLEEVNRQLCTLIFNGQFVTLQILVVDPDGGPIEITSAGHPAPLLAEDDRFTPLPVDSHLVLGVDPEAIYETTTINLPAGASILLYTDGASDVQSPGGDRLGTEGLRRTCPRDLASGQPADAKTLLNAVVHALNHFRGTRELGDDLTLVSIRLTQASPAETPELVGAA